MAHFDGRLEAINRGWWRELIHFGYKALSLFKYSLPLSLSFEAAEAAAAGEAAAIAAAAGEATAAAAATVKGSSNNSQKQPKIRPYYFKSE